MQNFANVPIEILSLRMFLFFILIKAKHEQNISKKYNEKMNTKSTEQIKKYEKAANLIDFLGKEEQLELGLHLIFKNKEMANLVLSKSKSKVAKRAPSREIYISQSEFERKKEKLLEVIHRLDYKQVSAFLNRKY